jgi:hypothetical protein
MKNPINYFKECIKSIDDIKKEILSKQQEIDTCKKQLDEIKSEKDSTSFKWYDVKSKADFNDEIKTKSRLLKAKIAKLEKEIKGLEKQKETETDKRNKLFLLSGIVAFFIIIAIVLIIGSISEKQHPEPQTTTEFVEVTKETKTTETTENITTTEAATETTEATTERATEAERTTEKETTKETTESTTSRSQKIVYSSKTGSHYHNDGCRYANGSKMTVAEAEKKGLEPCAVCNP